MQTGRLAQLDRRIAATAERVAEQRARLAWRQQHGCATAPSRELLCRLEENLALLLWLRAILARPGWSPTGSGQHG